MAQMDDANKRTATASDTVTRVLGHCLAREATARARQGWEIVRRALKAHTHTHVEIADLRTADGFLFLFFVCRIDER
jgi:hypothetical protein